MKKVAVLIRVYDRLEDLKNNLQIITDTWVRQDYYIIVVSNGKSAGYMIDDETSALIDKSVILENNAGHKKGNSQLLVEGSKYIPEDCEYTIILEADTWIYKDKLIRSYIDCFENDNQLMWASANWYDNSYSLAVDFAIIRTRYIHRNIKVFDFDDDPERYVANYLRDTDAKFMWLTENMPVHVPSYVYKYPYVNNSKDRRFYVFPKSKTVTHHVEFLRNGMNQKKRYFNIVAQTNYFLDHSVKHLKWERFKMQFWIGVSSLFLKKSWYSKKVCIELKA